MIGILGFRIDVLPAGIVAVHIRHVEIRERSMMAGMLADSQPQHPVHRQKGNHSNISSVAADRRQCIIIRGPKTKFLSQNSSDLEVNVQAPALWRPFLSHLCAGAVEQLALSDRMFAGHTVSCHVIQQII
jgi:hypothetical protein